MPEPSLIGRQREALHDLIRLAAERQRAEEEAERSRTSRDAKADREYEDQRQAIATRYQTAKETARREDEEKRRAIASAAASAEAEAKSEFAKASRRIATEFDKLKERAKEEYQHAHWEATTVYEAGQKEAAAKLAARNAQIDEAAEIHGVMRDRFGAVHDDYKKFRLKTPATTPSAEATKVEDPIGTLFDRLAKAEPDLVLLEGLFIPKSLKGWRFLWIFVVLFLALIYPLATIAGWEIGLGVDLVITIGLGLVIRSWLYSVARTQVNRLLVPLGQELADDDALVQHGRAWAQDRHKVKVAQLTERREEEVRQAKKKQARIVSEGEALRDDQLRRINEIYAQRKGEAEVRRREELRAAITAYERRKVDDETQYRTDSTRLEDRYRSTKVSIQSRYESSWQALATAWREGMARVRTTLEEVGREVDRLGPAWDDPAWADRRLPTEMPPVLRFGEVRLKLDEVPHGPSKDPRLMEGIPTSFRFPSLLPFPDRSNLVIEAPGEGKGAAVELLQAAMMRLLTTLPPGKVRFTIIDPVGLGRNFGAFMHLADYDEAMVTNRIWTEPQQIEQKLADLSGHMEKVLQKYLRNEYETIEEYNAQAGEVAEPFRVLVVADFPVNFDETAGKRLARIAASGVRCGVLTLIAVDPERELPPGMTSLQDLRTHAVSFAWDGHRLVWKDPDFRDQPLALDPPPPADFTTKMLHVVGAAAKHASRVEVPFDFIAPAPDSWWSADSRAGIDVALGKAGATKRQHLMLGKGTSQHVLIAGRTGSGKSTLLHALITNLALNYSPDEVELYLIDFKKGVEFKTYATHELPHARVVAIESEREFGLSVLQRLDAELKDRADKFRDAGVQDLNGYRNTPGTPPLPRILLIVDEFQEFFVEDDKVAQEASLLLDRLVRQGRAFGVHIHLGSQTLGGAYALARSTLGQMAIRIALQCSEADSHLILSEENTAARLLSRPGEAVYNDANGMVEGNHFFQVVWLSDERREGYLTRLHELARKRKPVLSRPQIVFEGNTASELSKNPLLQQRLAAPAWPANPRSAHAWLGEAVAIKDPTSALFRRQGGNHLLIVGQNEEAALGIMVSSLISLASQFSPPESDTTRSGAKFYVLDGTPEDHPHHGIVPGLAEVLPHPLVVGGWRDVAKVLGELSEELERRQQPDTSEGPELFLFLHDMQRFRDLRKRDDDFGFSRREEAASPADQLSALLREGPGLGIHVLAWCDNLNNLNRSFDRQSLREFEMRVLFQMSPSDSSHLIDAPYASKLGPHRAFFSSEEQGRLEKFRPYGLPPEEWLASIRDQFRRRGAALPDRPAMLH
jgi:hypothetical protein